MTVELINSLTSEPAGSQFLYLAGSAVINQGLVSAGVWPYNLSLVENWTLQQDTTIGNDLFLNSATLTRNGFTLTVTGTTYNNGGTIVE